MLPAFLPRRCSWSLGSRAHVPATRHSIGRQLVCKPCRITNERSEIHKALGTVDPDELDTFTVHNPPVWDPDKGYLDERVGRVMADEVNSDAINIQETAYWFTEPPGGWVVDEEHPKPEYVEATFPQPKHDDHLDIRHPLDVYEEGECLVGVITDIWLYHGAQVDFGGVYDGLIPIREAEWPDVNERLLPGTPVVIRVHKIVDTNMYRWPVQLELIDEEVAPLIMSPDEYEVPANVGWMQEQGMSPEECAEALGREWKPTSMFSQVDDGYRADEMQYAYGHDDAEFEPYEEDWITRELDMGTELLINHTIAEVSL